MVAAAERESAPTATNLSAPMAGSPRSRRRVVWRQLRRQKIALIGGAVLTLLAASAIFANVLAPFDPTEQIPQASLHPPSRQYLLGTDVFGRDIFSRILYGGRISLRIGLISVAIAASTGIA